MPAPQCSQPSSPALRIEELTRCAVRTPNTAQSAPHCDVAGPTVNTIDTTPAEDDRPQPVRTETVTQRVFGGRFACAVGSAQDDRAREQQRKLYRRSFERGKLPSVPALAESVRVHVADSLLVGARPGRK